MEEKQTPDEEEIEREVPEKRDYEEELLKIIKSDDPPSVLKEKLLDYHENDIASIIPELTPQERSKLYKSLGVDLVSEIFAYLDDVDKYIEELDAEKAADIIESMDADDAIDVLDELEEDKNE